ncbi:S8 family serine peptidase [Deinococcus aquatilis]|uniref:S8 family serine peptidase n=1 Tax=Deinococcus aquatilis TaxID=519440 RepID=UPI00037DF1B6|nr:S8 family serine peptidase [Deinococcus aquatilis]
MNKLSSWAAGVTAAGLIAWAVSPAEVPWNLSQIDLPSALVSVAARPTVVAILDTGLSAQPVLQGVQRAGYDFVTNPRDAGDHSGRDPDPTASIGGVGFHGTAVAGLIHSVNPQATLVHVRVIGRANTTTLKDARDGLRWAAGLPVPGVPRNPLPARVINASFVLRDVARTGCAPAMQRAVDEVVAHGTVIVASAGNQGAPAVRNTPAGCRGVIAVAATDPQGRRTRYSNWGSAVALAAPGGTAAEGIDTLRPSGGQTELTGTSLSAPLVAGAVSLLLTARPNLTPAAVRTLLLRSARPFAGGQCDRVIQYTCGAGVLDVAAALQAAQRELLPVGRAHSAPFTLRSDQGT